MNRKFFVFTEDTFLYKLYINMGGGEALQDTKHCDELYTSVSNTLKKNSHFLFLFFLIR